MEAGKADLGLGGVLTGGLRQDLTNTVGRHLGRAFADFHPLAGGRAADFDGGSQLRGLTARVGEVLRAGQADEVDIGITEQCQNSAVQGGVAHDDDLVHLGVDHVVIGGHLSAAEEVGRSRVHRVIGRGCRGLGDGGDVLQPIYFPGFVARDDKGVAAEIDGHLAVVGPARGTSAVLRTIRRGTGQLLPYQRGIEGHVDVHLAIIQEALGDARDITRGLHLGSLRIHTEDAGLLNSLGGPRAHQAGGAVRADDGQRGMRVMRLHHRGQSVGHRGTGGHDDAYVPALDAGEAEGSEGSGALIEAGMHANIAAREQRQRQRRVA